MLTGGLFQRIQGTVIGRLRSALTVPRTGLWMLMIGVAPLLVGIQDTAGGVPAMGTEAHGNGYIRSPAPMVIFSIQGTKVFALGI